MVIPLKDKMKPVDMKSSKYSSKEINDKDPKFKIGNIVRISKYKNVFSKDYVPNWPEEVFVITKVENNAPWTYVISDRKPNKIWVDKDSEFYNRSKFSGGRVKNELDLCNYATKEDLKNETGVDTSKFAKKVDLAA